MPTVTSRDGVKLYVKDWGGGRPVILIHGWPLSADMWEYQMPALLNAGFRVIAYDRRGFGRSEQPGWGYDYDTMADDLAAVIDQSGATQAMIVGFSMGGGEVARYLGRHGSRRVARAALISSVVPGLLKSGDNPEGAERSVFEEMTEALKKDRPDFLSSFGKEFVGAGVISKPVSSAMMDWLQMLALQASPMATVECVRAFGTTDFTRDLDCFDLPTLVIHGTSDDIVPIDATGRRVKQRVPHAELKEYEGAPHGLFLTNADELGRDLIDFLRR